MDECRGFFFSLFLSLHLLHLLLADTSSPLNFSSLLGTFESQRACAHTHREKDRKLSEENTCLPRYLFTYVPRLVHLLYRPG